MEDTAIWFGLAPKPDMPYSCSGVEVTVNRHKTLRKPEWLRVKIPGDGRFAEIRRLLRSLDLPTVCFEAACPNRAECWSEGHATVMILGDVCTRSCAFCNVKSGRPAETDPDEPDRVAEAVRLMGIRHVVITSVTRDDLPDEGAGHWAKVIRAVNETGVTVEALVPDFHAKAHLIKTVTDAAPLIYSHNIETVRRLTPSVRSVADYDMSLKALKTAASLGAYTKSGLMVGLGETKEEVLDTLRDLRSAGVKVVTLGQYLQPTRQNHPVHRYVTPEEFDLYAAHARELGFDGVESAPLVRSSYHATRHRDLALTHRAASR